jgi:hypothetical protein
LFHLVNETACFVCHVTHRYAKHISRFVEVIELCNSVAKIISNCFQRNQLCHVSHKAVHLIGQDRKKRNVGDCVTAQSQETDGEGEPFSFSKLFHDVEAYYISIGMTYEQFWHGDVWLAKVYRDAEELRERRANAEAWRNGFYMASALSSTVGNMFRKKGSKPIKYMDRPIPLTQKEKDEYEYQRAVEAQERIKRMMFSMMESDGGSDG